MLARDEKRESVLSFGFTAAAVDEEPTTASLIYTPRGGSLISLGGLIDN